MRPSLQKVKESSLLKVCLATACLKYMAHPRMIWPSRDLGRTRTQVACRLHAVLCELVPGGVAKAITAGQAAQVLGSITPPDAVAVARRDLAAAFIDDLRGIDARIPRPARSSPSPSRRPGPA